MGNYMREFDPIIHTYTTEQYVKYLIYNILYCSNVYFCIAKRIKAYILTAKWSNW